MATVLSPFGWGLPHVDSHMKQCWNPRGQVLVLDNFEVLGLSLGLEACALDSITDMKLEQLPGMSE